MCCLSWDKCHKNMLKNPKKCNLSGSFNADSVMSSLKPIPPYFSKLREIRAKDWASLWPPVFSLQDGPFLIKLIVWSWQKSSSWPLKRRQTFKNLTKKKKAVFLPPFSFYIVYYPFFLNSYLYKGFFLMSKWCAIPFFSSFINSLARQRRSIARAIVQL